MRRATEWAANVGKIVAYLMAAYALYLVLVAGSIIGGVWTAAIAWFLHNAASTSVEQLVFEQRLRRLRVGDIITRDDAVVSPDITVSELVDQLHPALCPTRDAGRPGRPAGGHRHGA